MHAFFVAPLNSCDLFTSISRTQCQLHLQSQFVSWCFEPNHSQRITSGLNTNFRQTPSYPFHKSLYKNRFFFFLFLLFFVFFSQSTFQILSTISECKTRKAITHVLGPIYIPRAFSTEICNQQGDLFYSAGLQKSHCQPQLTQEKLGRCFEKCR